MTFCTAATGSITYPHRSRGGPDSSCQPMMSIITAPPHSLTDSVTAALAPHYLYLYDHSCQTQVSPIVKDFVHVGCQLP
jgi:hypothetical protein